MFAKGIENSYPTIQTPDGRTVRQDELAKTKHYKFWKEDFRLLNELGIHHLRYGPPYFSVHIGPGKYDWSFADETLNRFSEALHRVRTRVRAAVSVDPFLHASERDLHRGNIFSEVRLVE